MKSYLYLLLVLALVTMGAIDSANAQVTIGALDIPEVTLEVIGQANEVAVPDGVLIPRLTGYQLAAKDDAYDAPKHSTLVYVYDAVQDPTPKTIKVTAPGFYYYDADGDEGNGLWEPLSQCEPAQAKKEWFYMPPFPIEVTYPGPSGGYSIDLYNAFLASTSTPTPGSGGEYASTGSISSKNTNFGAFYNIGNRGDYDYYVVGFDEELFKDISIDTNGNLGYDVIKDATDKSYINIVFVRTK